MSCYSYEFYLYCSWCAIWRLRNYGGLVVKDASTIGRVSGFIGTVVGYMLLLAKQVVSFFFGSSKGSDRKTDAFAGAFKNLK
ncbi:MAG: hypothetical protein JWM78_1266 [Verrucomicrobiaceae bacterium]|nr:hypothetical protein [Verrucomicrobiaceae bacterium]